MKRSELYAMVWEQPMTKVAARFGLSGRGLAKICARNHIPVPPRGYWAQAAANHYPGISPLPSTDRDYEIQQIKLTAAGVEVPGTTEQESPAKRMNAQLSRLAKREKPLLTDSSSEVADTASFDAALENECDRVIAAALEFQRLQAAEVFIKEVVGRASTLDDRTTRAVMTWARAVGERVRQRDPVLATVETLKKSAIESNGPAWIKALS